jgi:signal transduction histidine kinase
MGVLAGGIAHDFNNLLATILGNLYLVRQDLPEGSPLHAYIDDAKIAGERGADLVRKLLGFSRPGLARRERLSLDALFAETAALVRRTLSPDIELVFESDSEDDLVLGEYSSLQQVLLNLLLNAGDAMPGGGRLTVSRSIREVGVEPLWAQRGLLPGRYQEVRVTDTGLGMSRELLQRIFDPFFTTKGVGKGTGLGLSTALSIVRAHSGWLDAESTEGEGSTFWMLLPAAT